MELGVATFADVASGVSPEQRMRQLIEEAELADQLGLDVFAVGEHHRPDFAVSAPAVALAAIAARTERIRLSSAVTVLSSDDPVRVFQDFATLDLISGGRAEIMAGRGSFRAPYLAMMNRIGRERGWPPSGEREYAALRSPRGALAAGSPEEVAGKILYEHELFGHQRYLAQMSVGAVQHADVLRSLERFGTEVAPV